MTNNQADAEAVIKYTNTFTPPDHTLAEGKVFKNENFAGSEDKALNQPSAVLKGTMFCPSEDTLFHNIASAQGDL